MPSLVVHQAAGVTTGALASIAVLAGTSIADDQRGVFMAAMAFGGLLGGAAPDKLEPAFSPRHRQFYHSFAVAALIMYVTYRVARPQRTLAVAATLRPEPAALAATGAEGFLTALILGFGVGYVSHLVLDAQTPSGIPIL